jgi:2-dehydro-3-deoxygluconokinase
MTRVASIGECMVELTLPAESGSARVGFAGDTLNTAVYIKRSVPAVSVAYVTALGTDALSERMIDFFRGEDLDTGLIERRPDRAPGLYAISTDASGERSFTYWRENSAARTLFEPPAEVTPARLEGSDLIYLSGITLAVMSARARG